MAVVAVIALVACGEPTGVVDAPAAVSATATSVADPTATIPTEPTPPPTPLSPPPLAAAPVAVPTVVGARVPTVEPSPTPTRTPTPEVEPTPTSVPPIAVPVEPSPTPTAEPEPELEPQPAPPVNGASPRAEEALQTEAGEVLSTVEVVIRLRPSVVQISTESVAAGVFNIPTPQEGVGTGIILDEEGHILTNNHVVENAATILVTLESGQVLTAELVGGDLGTDTAVVRIDAEGLTPARLGDASEVQVGEDVVAIGHALGLAGGPTVSKGVVSALGRAIETDPETQTVITDLIQTDASINPGNSGGPLVNDRAEVIGVNTAIIEESRGIGFAINIDDARTVAFQLIASGFVNRGFLGITPVNVTPVIAGQFDLPVTTGILIARVITGTGAEIAGMQVGDVIIRLGDTPIVNTGELSKFLIRHAAGETVVITFYRAGEEMTREVTLGENPDQAG